MNDEAIAAVEERQDAPERPPQTAAPSDVASTPASCPAPGGRTAVRRPVRAPPAAEMSVHTTEVSGRLVL